MNWFLIILGFVSFVAVVVHIQKSDKQDFSSDWGTGIAIGVSSLIMILGVFL